MCIVYFPQVDDSESKMNANLVVIKLRCSLTNECKRLCEDKERVDEVKRYSKFQKKKVNTI